MAMVLPSILKGEVLRPYHNKHALNQAFKNCTSKVCVSRVSFCIIMKDCGCGAQPREFCGCCEDCYRCLGSNLWRKCCDCVGLCGFVSLNSTGNGLGIPSKFGELSGQSLPTLFEALSQNTTHQMPVMFMTRPRKGGLKKHVSSRHKRQCKVAFFDACITREDCITYCSNMGAIRYRWFRNGCCQCIDQRCLDYGELQPLCKNCLAN